jgi:MotA/TolQ/ExbB proton channel family
MFTSSSIGLMHLLTGYLLEPVIWLLIVFTAFAILDIGCLLAERFVGLKRWRDSGRLEVVERLAIRRIERSDFLTRIAPMLGLMGTLIPLGPGLSALGEGELSILTTAMSVAFDTTVLGLLVGVAGFVMGRIRRRWYDELLTVMEEKGAAYV